MGPTVPSLVLLALALALAGCAGLPGAPEEARRPSYLYRCPGEAEVAEAPCARFLTAEDERATDAFLAVHPSRAGVLAVAAQLAAPLPGWAASVARGHGTAYYDCQVAVFRSADGGRSWSPSLVPAPPAPAEAQPHAARCVNQPSLAYDEDGVLHVVASVRRWAGSAPATLLAWETSGEWVDPGAYEVHNLVYYVRSTDGGSTWGEPVVLAVEANHPWLSRDAATQTLYAAWRNLGEGEATAGGEGWTSEVAWSSDGGSSWDRLDPATLPSCHLPGPVALHAGDVLLACSNEAAGEGRAAVRVFALDRARATVEPRGAFEYGADRWAAAGLTSFPDGSLGLHLRETDAEPTERWNQVASRLLRSADGGRTWAAPLDVAALVEGSWDRVEVVSAGSDAQGGYHVVVELARAEGEGHAYDVRHLVVGAEGGLLHDVSLASGVRGERPSAAPPPWLGSRTLGNPYDGMVWDGDVGRFVVTPPGGEGALSLVEAWVGAVGAPGVRP